MLPRKHAHDANHNVDIHAAKKFKPDVDDDAIPDVARSPHADATLSLGTPTRVAGECERAAALSPLYDDVLGCLFGFFTLSRRCIAARVSRQWNRIARTAASHSQEVIVRKNNLTSIAASPILRKHLYGIRMTGYFPMCELVHLTELVNLRTLWINAEHLAPHNLQPIADVCAQMPFLRDLSVCTNADTNNRFLKCLLVPGRTFPCLRNIGHISLAHDILDRICSCAPNLDVLDASFLGAADQLGPMLERLGELPSPLVRFQLTNYCRGSIAYTLDAHTLRHVNTSGLRSFYVRRFNIDASMVTWLASIPTLHAIEFNGAHELPDFSAFAHAHLREFCVDPVFDWPVSHEPTARLNPCAKFTVFRFE